MEGGVVGRFLKMQRTGQRMYKSADDKLKDEMFMENPIRITQTDNFMNSDSNILDMTAADRNALNRGEEVFKTLNRDQIDFLLDIRRQQQSGNIEMFDDGF